jgi:hypothetical protein
LGGEAAVKAWILLFLAGMDNKNFSEKMKRHGVTLDAFKTNPPA